MVRLIKMNVNIQKVCEDFLTKHNNLPNHIENIQHHYAIVFPFNSKDWYYQKGGFWSKFKTTI